MYNNITGIILSGGKSSRMGTNKSFLKIGDKTVIEIVVNLMKSVFNDIIISANSEPEYSFFNYPIVTDKFKNAGPLAGIHSALSKSETEKNFVISCDVPLMSKQIIEFFADYNSDKKIIISHAAGYLQPLVGIYQRSLLPLIEKILIENENQTDLRKKHLSLHTLIESTTTEIVDVSSLPFYSDIFFYNMNSKDDFDYIVNNFNQ